MARWLIVIGITLALAGTLWHFFPGLFNWFGKLPGDLRFESERTRVFVPITSMIIVSLVATIIINLLNR